MKSYKVLLMLVLVFVSVGSIRDLGPTTDNDLYYKHINVYNRGEEDLDDLQVRIYIYDLGVLLQTNSFDMDDGDKDGKYIFWDVPNYVEPGDYWARITVSNDDVRRVKHRIITIV